VPETRYRSVVLLGAPGSGKGTQGEVLGTIPGLCHFSSGDMFRSLDPESELGRTVAAHSSRGALVPDDLTIRLFLDHMARRVAAGRFDPARQILVLDGIPRNVAQATILREHIDALGVIHLDCADREELVRRLQSRARSQNRADDAREEVVRHRLEVYDRLTRPVLESYPASIVHRVEATGSPARVLRSLLDVLVPLVETHVQGGVGARAKS
jgi:adenylate kinase